MPDQNLNDDSIKLVRFKVLVIKRDCERVLVEREELIQANIDNPQSYTARKIAEVIESLGVPKDDRKYLRVWWEVLDRFRNEARDQTGPG